MDCEYCAAASDGRVCKVKLRVILQFAFCSSTAACSGLAVVHKDLLKLAQAGKLDEGVVVEAVDRVPAQLQLLQLLQPGEHSRRYRLYLVFCQSPATVQSDTIVFRTDTIFNSHSLEAAETGESGRNCRQLIVVELPGQNSGK